MKAQEENFSGIKSAGRRSNNRNGIGNSLWIVWLKLKETFNFYLQVNRNQNNRGHGKNLKNNQSLEFHTDDIPSGKTI